MNKYICPVCWSRAVRTQNANIRPHLDGVSNECPASGEPHAIALVVPTGNTVRRAMNEARQLLAVVA